MSRHLFVDSNHAASILRVLGDVSDALSEIQVDGCNREDVHQIVARASAELQRSRPSVNTLSTYLNSLARSLRLEPNARTVVLELDAAMRAAHIPTNWEP